MPWFVSHPLLTLTIQHKLILFKTVLQLSLDLIVLFPFHLARLCFVGGEVFSQSISLKIMCGSLNQGMMILCLEKAVVSSRRLLSPFQMNSLAADSEDVEEVNGNGKGKGKEKEKGNGQGKVKEKGNGKGKRERQRKAHAKE